MADYTTKDAVDFAVDGNSSEFKNAVHDILSQRVQSAIELKKVDVTANFMSGENHEDDVEDTLPSEVEPEVEPEETEEESDEETDEIQTV